MPSEARTIPICSEMMPTLASGDQAAVVLQLALAGKRSHGVADVRPRLVSTMPRQHRTSSAPCLVGTVHDGYGPAGIREIAKLGWSEQRAPHLVGTSQKPGPDGRRGLPRG